jgi:DNA-binding Lrp family transcriptional regulator
MERALVLINLAPGTEEEAIASLRGGAGITEVYQLYGLYDALMIVEGSDEAAVKSVISERLRSNPNIVSTMTMKVVG